MASNNQIATWQRALQTGKETTFGTAILGGACNTMGTIGIPKTDLGPAFVDAGETGSGTSERLVSEFSVGNKQGKIDFDCRSDDVRLYHMLRSLFQVAPTVSTGPYVAVWNPYTAQPATNIGTTVILNPLSGLAAASLVLSGAICHTVKLESSEGSIVKVSAGYQGTGSSQVQGAASLGTWLGTKKHMHFDGSLKLAGGSNVKPSKIALEISNNLIAYYGTAQLPTDLALGQFTMKGQFAVPWTGSGLTEFANYLTKTARQITIEYGTAAAAGYVKADFDATFSVANIEDQNGLTMGTFDFVQSKSATTTAITVVTAIDQTAL